MKFNLIFIIILVVSLLTGCTKNQRAKNFGGRFTETLPAGQKLVNVTWKEEHMWILSRQMKTNDVAESYSFKESSSWGLLQGIVTIVETK